LKLLPAARPSLLTIVDRLPEIITMEKGYIVENIIELSRPADHQSYYRDECRTNFEIILVQPFGKKYLHLYEKLLLQK